MFYRNSLLVLELEPSLVCPSTTLSLIVPSVPPPMSNVAPHPKHTNIFIILSFLKPINQSSPKKSKSTRPFQYPTPPTACPGLSEDFAAISKHLQLLLNPQIRSLHSHLTVPAYRKKATRDIHLIIHNPTKFVLFRIPRLLIFHPHITNP